VKACLYAASLLKYFTELLELPVRWLLPLTKMLPEQFAADGFRQTAQNRMDCPCAGK